MTQRKKKTNKKTKKQGGQRVEIFMIFIIFESNKIQR